MHKISDKVKNAESNITTLQGEVSQLKQQVNQMSFLTGALDARVEDVKGHSRHNNIRLLDFPKRAEGLSVEAFLEKWVQQSLRPSGLTPQFIIDRAHRALGPMLVAGAPPRTLIARIFNYRDRDAILRAARESAVQQFENHNISIYPDYTQRVQESCKSCLEVKMKLQEMDIKYMLLYPAKLCVKHAGKSHFFEYPDEVWNELDMADKITVRNDPNPFRTRRRRQSWGMQRGRGRGCVNSLDAPCIIV